MTGRTMTDDEFDDYFDNGGDVTDYIVEGSVEHPNRDEVKRVNVDFPTWMVEGLDAAAAHLAINRQAVIKTWIADRLKAEHLA